MEFDDWGENNKVLSELHSPVNVRQWGEGNSKGHFNIKVTFRFNLTWVVRMVRDSFVTY